MECELSHGRDGNITERESAEGRSQGNLLWAGGKEGLVNEICWMMSGERKKKCSHAAGESYEVSWAMQRKEKKGKGVKTETEGPWCRAEAVKPVGGVPYLY